MITKTFNSGLYDWLIKSLYQLKLKLPQDLFRAFKHSTSLQNTVLHL